MRVKRDLKFVFVDRMEEVLPVRCCRKTR